MDSVRICRDFASFEIRSYCSQDSVAEITDLLHRSYADLAARGMRFLASHQGVSKTRERIEAGHCFVATNEGSIVGTIVVYTGDAATKCELYNQPDVARFGQFAVAPEHQGKGIGGALLRCAEQWAREVGCRRMALDTARGAGDLIALYEHHGYTAVGTVDWEITNYVSLVMVKSL